MRDGARAQGRVDPQELAGEGATRPAVSEVPVELVVGERDQYAAIVDAVDGSEFLDDRLRMVE